MVDRPRSDSRDSSLEELTARAQRIIAARQENPAPRAPHGAPHGAPHVPSVEAGHGTPVLVLGIDPGTAITGFGFVRRRRSGDGGGDQGEGAEAVAYGVIETAAEDPMPVRLLTLYRRLRDLIAAHRPAEAAVEQLFFGRNSTTAITVGQARGVALLALAEAGVPVTEYTAAEVKQAMAGFGRADKLQMQRMVQALLELPELPQPDDAADALAIALCHTRASRLREFGLR